MRRTEPRITLDAVYIAVALALIALRVLLTPIPPHDFWWHMAVGRQTVEAGAIPTTDTFSFTQAGQPYYNQGWLAQVGMYGLYTVGGLPLLILVQVVVICAAYGLLLWFTAVQTGRLRLAVAVLLLAILPVSFTNWNVRPQSYVLPIMAAYIVVLARYRQGVNRLWLLPLLMALWVNIHGTFVLGLVLIGLTVVGEALKWRFARLGGEYPAPLRPLLVWGSVSALAVLANPRGLGVLGYVRGLLGSNQVTELVTEWAPPTIRDANGVIFFLLAILLAGALIYARRMPDPTDLLIAGAFFWLALGASRSQMWFALVSMPLLVSTLARLLPRRPAFQGRTPLNATLLALLGLLILGALPWVKPLLIEGESGRLISSETPVDAVAAMRQLPRPERLLNASPFGSYLIWELPDQPVFIDPRFELYPYEQWQDYVVLSNGYDIDRLLERYQFDGMLLDPVDQKALVEAMKQRQDWRMQFTGEQSVYFLHQSIAR